MAFYQIYHGGTTTTWTVGKPDGRDAPPLVLVRRDVASYLSTPREEFADYFFHVAMLAIDCVVELAHVVVGNFSGQFIRALVATSGWRASVSWRIMGTAS